MIDLTRLSYDRDGKSTLPFPKKRSWRVFIGKHCCYCEYHLTSETYTKDHLIPKSRGGTITIPCCKNCNFQKDSLELEDYLILLQLTPFKPGYLRKIKNTKILIEILEEIRLEEVKKVKVTRQEFFKYLLKR